MVNLVDLHSEHGSKTTQGLTSANRQEFFLTSGLALVRLNSQSARFPGVPKFGRQPHRINTARLISLKKSN